jgi:twitching motility protein PilT
MRAQLSFVLEAVVSPAAHHARLRRGPGARREVMIPTPAIRNLMREDKIHQIYSQMQVGQTQATACRR